MELFPKEKLVGELILRDMEIHRIKACSVEEFCKDKVMAVSLLVVGLASFYANMELFGGWNSTSAKVKKKHFEQRGKAICSLVFEGKKN